MAIESIPKRAQLPAEQYARAERLLPDHLEDLAFGLRVRPTWVEGSDRFWYTNRMREGRETVVVDASAGTREVVVEPPDTAPVAPMGEMLSPDRRWSMLVRDDNLVVRDTTTGKERQLTEDGEPAHSYATAPDVTKFTSMLEPLGISLPPLGLWSPDSTRFLTHRIDQRSLPLMHLVQSNPADGGRPRLRSYRYAMVGEPDIAMAEVIIVDVASGEITHVQLDPMPVAYASPFFFKHVWWGSDHKSAYLLRSDRRNSELWLERIDAVTGETRTSVHERSDTYIDAHPMMGGGPNVRVLGDGAQILWWSERDDWGHLYLIDGANGQVIRQLTGGSWLVRDLVHVDENERMAYFTASGREPGLDPYIRQLYRVHLDTARIERLTNDELEHEITAFPSGTYFLDRASLWDTAPMTSVLNHAGKHVIEVQRADIELLRAEGWNPPERFVAKAADGETDIYGFLYRPPDFDAGRSYPVLDAIYPGPQTIRAFVNFQGAPSFADEPSMAALGFAVVTVDGRGTPLRGREFHRQSFGRLETAGTLEDHIAAIRQLGERYPWLGLGRVGIYGHSGGGFASTRAMLAHPEFYKVAVASAGNHDNLYYHVLWGEKYHGPAEGERYTAQANAALAGNLQGKLLLMHGEMDDNVHPYLTMRLVQALIKANKDFDLLIIPNAEHGMFESKAYTIRRRWDYFVEHLLGMEPPPGYRLAEIPFDAERLAEMFGG